jgi:hypothetical protein
VDVVNQMTNFGWEYVWHCHILGHEENDMMRVLALAVAPEAPANLLATVLLPLKVHLAWNDNAVNATHFIIQRATDAGFTTNLATFTVGKAPGTAQTYTDTSVVPKTTYHYRVLAANVVGNALPGYPTVSANSAPTNAAQVRTPAELWLPIVLR